MRVMVTGGLGYIGSHVCVDLLSKGHEVGVIDNLANSTTKVLDGIKSISGKEIKLYLNDIRDMSQVDMVFQDFKPDFVIHFAGLKSVSDSVVQPLDYYETNVSGTVNTLKAMDLIGCTKIIFSSSATVYGEPVYTPCDEEHPTNPVNPYGRTKLLAESLIHDWVLASSKKKAIVFRYFNPVGAHLSGLIGESPKGRANNIMPMILDVATGAKDCLSIFGDDYKTRDGTGVRDYIHVSDLSLAHVLGMERLEQHEPYLVLNLGTGKNHSIFELIRIFEDTTGLRVKTEIASRRQGDLAEVWASNQKARRVLGVELDRTLSDMCEDALRWKLGNV